MPSKINSSKEMKKLIQKEKELHKEIRSDFKKITNKINKDLDLVKKSKLNTIEKTNKDMI